MQKQARHLHIALLLGVFLQAGLTAATPDQPYHRTPHCIDGNCFPNRATSGYHATRWRPWPGGEPSQNPEVPPVGIELPRVTLPPRDKELELPSRPSEAGENSTAVPSPNDIPGSGVVPPEFRDVTPKKPIEEKLLPGNSNLQRGPMFPGTQPSPKMEPLLLSKKPEPLNSMPAAIPLRNVPAEEPPAMLKIRPASNSQSGLMPEMVPWDDEDKNPIVRQVARISGDQVQHTINIEESRLPNANENRGMTFRVRHEDTQNVSTAAAATDKVRLEANPIRVASVERIQPEPAWRSPDASAPAMLPTVEARPLLPTAQPDPLVGSTSVASPLRGLSQGNPLRR